MSDFVKLTSIHLQWYLQHSAAKDGVQKVIKEHVTELAEKYGKLAFGICIAYQRLCLNVISIVNHTFQKNKN